MKPTRGTVAHAVRSDSFAGVERYICDVSTELAAREWRVFVVGGDARLMRRHLPTSVTHLPARTTSEVRRGLAAAGPLDLVHAHMTAAEAAAVLSRRRTRARVVATRHFAAPRGRHAALRAAGRFLAKGIDLEIAISHFVAGRVEGAPLVLHNGVPEDAQPSALSVKSILVLQRLQVEKDTATAVRAFALSGLAYEGWRLHIAGRGDMAGTLDDLSVRLGVTDAVELVGFVEDPGRLRREASIFLATAPAEPFGLSLVEAMAAGLPIVAADGGAHPELLADCGVMFPPGDAAACARLLRRLAASPVERRAWGAKARVRQRASLSVPGHVDRLEQFYEQVLSTQE